MAPDNNDWDRLYNLLKDGFDGVHNRLDDLNGRTRKVENKVAVLEDRGARDPTARWTAGAAIGLGAMVEVLKQVWGAK